MTSPLQRAKTTTSMPRVTTTTNIYKLQPTKKQAAVMEEEKERRFNWEGVQGKCILSRGK